MEKINKLKTQMSELLDKATDKEMIESLTKISETIDGIAADTTALEEDRRSLLNDYKEMVKHTSFKTEKEPERVVIPETVKFEDFFKK